MSMNNYNNDQSFTGFTPTDFFPQHFGAQPASAAAAANPVPQGRFSPALEQHRRSPVATQENPTNADEVNDWRQVLVPIDQLLNAVQDYVKDQEQMRIVDRNCVVATAKSNQSDLDKLQVTCDRLQTEVSRLAGLVNSILTSSRHCKGPAAVPRNRVPPSSEGLESDIMDFASLLRKL